MSRISILHGLCALTLSSLLAGGATPALARTGELREMRCDKLEMDNGRVVVVEASDIHVLRDTALGGDYRPALGSDVASIMCSRTSIVPAANDDEVIWLGMPLHIAQMGSPGRLGVLEIERGRYRFRVIEGRAPNPAEQAAIDARLAEFQARFRPR